MLYFHSWSGGKDSTASIILDHIHGLPPSKIVFCEVMFDKKRNISGELPEHIEFVREKCIPLFQEWGYETIILRSDSDYLDLFYHVIEKTSVLERKGKYGGWLIGGRCAANRDLKVGTIQKFFRQYKEKEYTQYIGIAADEPKRLERLRGTNKISLLERYHYTEQQAFDLCNEYGLLSPTYSFSKRGGCWFCPNQKIAEFAHTKEHYPLLWQELERLSQEPNIVSQKFKYDKTFQQIAGKVDEYLENQYWKENQLSIFDCLQEG